MNHLLADEIRINSQAEVKIKKANHLEFEIGYKTVTVREIDSAFPNWEMVIPNCYRFPSSTLYLSIIFPKTVCAENCLC